jgi:hypothetical protein
MTFFEESLDLHGGTNQGNTARTKDNNAVSASMSNRAECKRCKRSRIGQCAECETRVLLGHLERISSKITGLFDAFLHGLEALNDGYAPRDACLLVQDFSCAKNQLRGAISAQRRRFRL